MTLNVTSPVTGSAQTGFTTPGYTLTNDIPPDINGRQYAVTGLTGTQVGATSHSVSSPFTLTVFRPKTYRNIGTPNPVTGVVSNVPKNTHKIITRKGAVPLAGQLPQVFTITSNLDVPAGTDVASPAELRAAISLHIGALQQISAGLGDTVVSGVM